MIDTYRGNPRVWFLRLPILVAGLVLAAAGLPPVGTAQQPEGVRARMEYDRTILYSGRGRNLSVLRQRAHARMLAMPRGGMMRRGGADLRWRPLGPHRRGYGPFMVTGRVIAIAIHPEDYETIYVGGGAGRRLEVGGRR